MQDRHRPLSCGNIPLNNRHMETLFLCEALPKAGPNSPCESFKLVMTDHGVTRLPYSTEVMMQCYVTLTSKRIDVRRQNTVA
jgi:hypothetical protein